MEAEELPLPITAIAYDEAENVLVSGYQHLQSWRSRLHQADAQAAQADSHPAPVSAALFNSSFGVVVSADAHSSICVWSIETGQLSGRFSEAHGAEAITSLAFDGAQRRLVSGAHDGSLKLWNFSSGECLKQCLNPDTAELTALCHIGGSSRLGLGLGLAN